VLSTTSLSYAGPALDDFIDIQQPDGASFKARKHGDEFQHWTETEGGHTVIRNKKTNEWEYAEQNPDGTLRGSGQKVIPDQKAPANIPRNLKPPRNTKAEKALSQSLQEIYNSRIPSSSTTPLSQSTVSTSYAVGDWTPLPVSGVRKIIVLLVNFTDRSLTTTPSGWSTSVFSTTVGVKSVANYYQDNSFNTLSITPVPHSQAGNPAGVVTVSVPYVHPDNGTVESTWVAAAINAADPYVDFSSLDTNSNGYIDRTEAVVYLIPAGYEESGSSKVPSVWAHATWYSGGGLSAAGKLFPAYAMNGELNNSDLQHPIGVIAHEMGHQFCGLPDLYDTSSQNQGLGYFSLMASGSWGLDTGEQSGTTPTNLDAWSREYLGWASPLEPVSDTTLSLAYPLSSQDAVYKLISPLVSSTEYFLVENRQPVGWDQGLRGRSSFGSAWAGGLLITHIDITAGTVGSNDINRYTANNGRQGVIPVQASTALCNMLSVGASCRGAATTLFYLGNNSNWSPDTTPNSNYYSGEATNFSLMNISSQASTMTGNLSLIPPVVISLPEAIDNDAWTVTTGGSGNWTGQSATTHDAVDAAKSATITDSQSSWMETTVTGPGTLSFWWKVSSESGYDKLKYYVDGVQQGSEISGESGWVLVTGVSVATGSHTIKWEYSKDSSSSSGSDAGWVDQVVFAPSVFIPLSGAIDNDAWTVTTGGNGNWAGQSGTSHDTVDAAKSGTITNSQSTWMETTVAGPGTLSFWWKVSSEGLYDKLKYYVDGVVQGSGISGESGWVQVTGVSVAAGSHTIKWEYSKDGSVSAGSDAGWVDQVVFAPSTYQVSFSFGGNGYGSVTSIPAGLACAGTTGSICEPYSFDNGSNVTLIAATSAGSTFSGWSGDCGGSDDCTLNMTADRSVTATFSLGQRARINGIPYSTLSSAYAAVSAGGVIESKALTFIENLTLNRGVPFRLIGGYADDYSSNTGYTTLDGILTIGTGNLILDRLIIQ